ncbi:hypothetical protein [Sorangium sp. So ce1078]|uniref:hypothetical protein n=1 Tax=Sorangium sp. So ce1078 TaxID=3133329 RepID=UPI003F5DD5FC
MSRVTFLAEAIETFRWYGEQQSGLAPDGLRLRVNGSVGRTTQTAFRGKEPDGQEEDRL